MIYRAQPVPITGVIFDYSRVLAWTQHQEPRAAWERRLGLAPGASPGPSTTSTPGLRPSVGRSASTPIGRRSVRRCV